MTQLMSDQSLPEKTEEHLPTFPVERIGAALSAANDPAQVVKVCAVCAGTVEAGKCDTCGRKNPPTHDEIPDLTAEDVDAEVRRLEAEAVAADLQYNREKADGTWHAEREARALSDPMGMLGGRGYGGDW